MIAIVGLMTLLVTLYAWRAPGPLFSFIARFYLGAPLAIVTIAVVSGVKIAMRWAPWSVSLAVAMTGIALVFNGTFISRNQNMAGIRELSNGVLDNLGAKERAGVRISFDTHEYAQLVAGLLLDLGRRGTPACVRKLRIWHSCSHLNASARHQWLVKAMRWSPSRPVPKPASSGRNNSVLASDG